MIEILKADITQDPTKAAVMYRCVPCGAILDPDTEWGSDCHHCGEVIHFMQEVRIICAARQLQRQHDDEDQADLYAMHIVEDIDESRDIAAMDDAAGRDEQPIHHSLSAEEFNRILLGSLIDRIVRLEEEVRSHDQFLDAVSDRINGITHRHVDDYDEHADMAAMEDAERRRSDIEAMPNPFPVFVGTKYLSAEELAAMVPILGIDEQPY